MPSFFPRSTKSPPAPAPSGQAAPREFRRAADKYNATTREKKPLQTAMPPDDVLILPAPPPTNFAAGVVSGFKPLPANPLASPVPFAGSGFNQSSTLPYPPLDRFVNAGLPPDRRDSPSPEGFDALRHRLELQEEGLSGFRIFDSPSPEGYDPRHISEQQEEELSHYRLSQQGHGAEDDSPVLADPGSSAEGGVRISDSMRDSSRASRVPENGPPTTTGKSRAPDGTLTTEKQDGTESPVDGADLTSTGFYIAKFLKAMEDIRRELPIQLASVLMDQRLPKDRIMAVYLAHFQDILELQDAYAAVASDLVDNIIAAVDTPETAGYASAQDKDTEPPQYVLALQASRRTTGRFIRAIRKLESRYSRRIDKERKDALMANAIDANDEVVNVIGSKWTEYCDKLGALEELVKSKKEPEDLPGVVAELENTLSKLQAAYKTEVDNHTATKLQLQEAIETTTDRRLLDERARHSDTRERLSVLRQKVEELHITVVEKDEDLEDLKGEKAWKDEELRKAQDRIKVLEEENKKMREDHARKITRLTDDSAREIQQKTREFDERMKSKDEKLEKAIEEHLAETKALKEVLLIVKGAVKDL